MLDETNPETEVVENLQETEVESDQSEELKLESEDGENSEPTEEELEEAEFEGKKYKLPKELKGALLRNADYTKKTQEVAAERKRIESEQQNFRQTVEARNQEFKAHAEVHHLEQEIGRYDKFFESDEWKDIIQNDLSRAFIAKEEYQALHNQRNQRAQEISQKERERSQQQQQHVAKLEEETRSTLSREIKGWGIELESNLVSYAKAQGFADDVMNHGLKTDAVAIKTIHKAYLYDQLVKKQLAKPKIEIKPIGKVQSGPSAVNKDPAKMSDAEYSKWRQSRIKASAA